MPPGEIKSLRGWRLLPNHVWRRACANCSRFGQQRNCCSLYYRAPSGLIRGDLKLSNVIRTGMFVDQDEQGIIDGQDAPVTEEDDNDLTKQKNLGDNFSY